MKVKVRHLHRLLLQLSEKTKEPLDRAGLRNMSLEVGGISEDYLYKKIFHEIKNLKEDQELSLRDAQLNSVARFLGYNNITAALSAFDTPADDQLKSLVGNYYVYIRQNSNKGLIFQSPVEIREWDGKFLLRLKGPSWTYEGEVRIKHGCLFILMTSADKSFYHIYKIGTRRDPKVIQGIFSGVSTAFDPIGGRAVLLKREESLATMKNQAFTQVEMNNSSSPEGKIIAAYFRDYSKNNLSINKVISFGIEDLED